MRWIVTVVVAALLPLVAGEYYINLSSQIIIFAVFAASINLLLGYGGLPTLGHAAYLGVAAYVSALLQLKLHYAHWLAAPLAVAATTAMGCAFGFIALRATGLGFLMLTLALSQVLWGTAYRWVAMTDGDNGLRGLQRPLPFGLDLNQAMPFYYFTLVIAGGSGTLAGPIVGAAIVLLLKNWASAYIERWNMLLGFVFVFIVVFMPEGVVPGVQRLWKRFVSKT